MGDVHREDSQSVLPMLQRHYLPRSAIAVRLRDPNNRVAHRSAQLDKLFAGKSSRDGQPVLYVCQNFTCEQPAVGLAAIEARLNAL